MSVTVSWSRVSVNGQPYRDALIAPGYVSEWDWKECGTSHIPGVTRQAVEKLLRHARQPVTDIILSSGFHEKLHVSPDCRMFLSSSPLKWWVLPTPRAVQLYNEMKKDPTRQPAALIHSTC